MPASDFTQTFNNYYETGQPTPAGTGNISVDPNFTSVVLGGFVPQTAMVGSLVPGPSSIPDP